MKTKPYQKWIVVKVEIKTPVALWKHATKAQMKAAYQSRAERCKHFFQDRVKVTL